MKVVSPELRVVRASQVVILDDLLLVIESGHSVVADSRYLRPQNFLITLRTSCSGFHLYPCLRVVSHQPIFRFFHRVK